jgi:predicted aspartyl protease
MPLSRFSQIPLLLICVSTLPAIAAPPTTEVTVRIKLVNEYLIVVPVTINGLGPYDFVLDTGSNNTMLDQKLADELALPQGKATTIIGANGSRSLSAVYAESVSIAGAMVDGKELFLFASTIPLPSKVRGVLGEDFLQHFDLLIDYPHQLIQLESGLSSMAETLRGEHLPIRLSGTVRGQPSLGRLILFARIQQLGENPLSLVLDSGANTLTLFRADLGVGSNRQTFLDSSSFKSSNIITRQTRTIRSLYLGKSELDDLTVIALAGHPDSDTDGLIPTLLFHSIFISHQGKFVILNPFLPKGGRQ